MLVYYFYLISLLKTPVPVLASSSELAIAGLVAAFPKTNGSASQILEFQFGNSCIQPACCLSKTKLA